jgi:hypothetical protein
MSVRDDTLILQHIDCPVLLPNVRHLVVLLVEVVYWYWYISSSPARSYPAVFTHESP